MTDTTTTSIEGVITGMTCGLSCWMAQEDVCRCSCGGRGHGQMLRGEGQPRRNCRIAGVRYVLAAVGDDTVRTWLMSEQADVILEAFGKSWREGVRKWLPSNFCVTKLASKEQSAKWPEAAMVEVSRYGRSHMMRQQLIWLREDAAPMFDSWAVEYEAECAARR